MAIELYSYFRSSASFRVRIALNLKGLPYDYKAVHLVRDGGQQFSDTFRALNPEALIPVLVDDDGPLTQSLAIVEYLDEMHAEPPLLPASPRDRARVRSLAYAIACDIHPLNNLRVLRYLVKAMGASEEAKDAWYRHWVDVGLASLEAQLDASPKTGRFCHGDTPTLADVCLVPQVWNAQRMKCDTSAMPTVMRIHEHCMTLDAFDRAAPAAQPDAE